MSITTFFLGIEARDSAKIPRTSLQTDDWHEKSFHSVKVSKALYPENARAYH
ncbi:MAG: hypothetical protein AAF959_12620 [Cyanobacteria bacterium P01_D01_bin.56]